MNRTKQKYSFLPWLSFSTVALYFAALVLCCELHYSLGDDYYLARAFAGEVGGVAESYNLFVHSLYVWLIHGLTLLFPGIWWFSWLQLLLLAVGSYCIVLGLSRTALRLGFPWWAGWLCAMVFMLTMTAEFTAAITFTTTTSILGAGAICMLGSVDLHSPHLSRDLFGAALPVLLAYMLRDVSALPIATFWVGLLLCKVLTADHRPRLSQLLKVLMPSLLLCCCLLGIRMVDNALTPEKENVEFLNATSIPVDYGGLDYATPETLDQLGWTEAEVALIRSWYFMDADMTAEAFRKVEADALAHAPSLEESLQGVKLRLKSLFTGTPQALDDFLVILGLCFASFCFAFLCKGRRLWRLLAPVGTAAVALLLLVYLAWQGRLPLRAASTILLPAAAMALVLAMEVFPHRFRPACLPGLLSTCCVALAMIHAGSVFWPYTYNPYHSDPNGNPYGFIETTLLSNPDILYVGDRSFGVDIRLFPDRSKGIPTNLLPMWGGWNNHSEGYRAAFERAGLNHRTFLITEFLGDKVRLITGNDGPSEVFLNYLSEKAGGDIEPIIEEAGADYYIYRFELQ